MKRRLLRKLYFIYCCIQFVLHNFKAKDQNNPIVSYGGLVPDIHRPGRGGNVKLTLLNTAYPESLRNFNILYGVSSGINIKVQSWWYGCRAKGIKLVWNQNGVAYPAWAPKDYKRLNHRMASCLHKADFVIYQSHFCRETADNFLGPFQGPNDVVYNAVDTAFFSPPANPIQKPLTLLVAGSHEHSGRIKVAVEALAYLKNKNEEIRLIIAGGLSWPDAERDIRQLVNERQLDGQISWHGPFFQKEAPDIYRSADILLHLKHADPCPTVVIEAMSCGLPIVGIRSGGVPELVDEHSGILLAVPEDLKHIYTPQVEDVVSAILKIQTHYFSYSAAARQRAVAKFDQALWLQKHKTIFEGVLKS